MKFSVKWIDIAASMLGVSEIPGSRHNPKVVEMLQSANPKVNDDETPWCAGFVNWVLEGAGLKGTDNLMARSYERWGVAQKGFVAGAVVTRWRGSKASGFGHVGFAVAKKPGFTAYLGGNQGDRVSVVWMPDANNTGFFWPKGVDVTPLSAEEQAVFAKLAASGSVSLT